MEKINAYLIIEGWGSKNTNKEEKNKRSKKTEKDKGNTL